MKNLIESTKLNIENKGFKAKTDTLMTFLKYDLFKKTPQDTKNINLDSNQEFFDIAELENILNDINNKNKAFIEESNQKEKQQIINKRIGSVKKEIEIMQEALLADPQKIQLIKDIENKENYIVNIPHQEIKIRKNKLLTDLLFLQINKDNKKILNQFNLSIKLPNEMLENNEIIKDIKIQIEKKETIAIAEELNNFFAENEDISTYIKLTKNINQLDNDIQKINFELIELANTYNNSKEMEQKLENFAKNLEHKERDMVIDIKKQLPIEEQYKKTKQAKFNNILINDFYLLDKYLNILKDFSTDSFFIQKNLKDENIAKVINAIQGARGHSEDYLYYAVEKYQNEITQDLLDKIKENNIDVKEDGAENIVILNVFSTNDACNRCSYKMNDILDIITSQLQKTEELNNIKTKLIYNSNKQMLYKSTNNNNKSYEQKSEGFSTSGSKAYHTTKNIINYNNLDSVKKTIDFDDFDTKSFCSQNLKSETKYNSNKIDIIDMKDNYSSTTEKPSNKFNGNKHTKLMSISMFKK